MYKKIDSISLNAYTGYTNAKSRHTKSSTVISTSNTSSELRPVYSHLHQLNIPVTENQRETSAETSHEKASARYELIAETIRKPEEKPKKILNISL